MSARNHEAERREPRGLVHRRMVHRRIVVAPAQNPGEEMRRDMIDRVKRHAARPGETLGRARADKQASDQPGPHPGGDRVDLVDSQPRLSQRPLDHRNDPLEMRAACDLRHHAAVFAVQVVLRRNHARADAQRVIDHRGGGLVAGTFDAEDASHRRTW